jgi:cell wall assembly regulator SMI1
MTPRSILEAARGETFRDDDGEEFRIELFPGLTEAEIAAFAEDLPAELPDDVRELLQFAGGFAFSPVEEVRFTGSGGFGMEEAFPHSVDLCGDGCGNFWIVDVNPESGAWAPIFYACHDPPVFVYQSPTLAEFLTQVLDLGRPGAERAIDHVHEERTMAIWARDPEMALATDARASADPDLRTFAESVPDNARICDLRSGRPGDGFAWGRDFGKTEIRRHGAHLLFALVPPPPRPPRQGLLSRLFGR